MAGARGRGLTLPGGQGHSSGRHPWSPQQGKINCLYSERLCSSQMYFYPSDSIYKLQVPVLSSELHMCPHLGPPHPPLAPGLSNSPQAGAWAGLCGTDAGRMSSLTPGSFLGWDRHTHTPPGDEGTTREKQTQPCYSGDGQSTSPTAPDGGRGSQRSRRGCPRPRGGSPRAGRGRAAGSLMEGLGGFLLYLRRQNTLEGVL